MIETIQRVICANCGWVGKRKTGKSVFCPKCGEMATFDIRDQQ